jgi:hypothetical protein
MFNPMIALPYLGRRHKIAIAERMAKKTILYMFSRILRFAKPCQAPYNQLGPFRPVHDRRGLKNARNEHVQLFRVQNFNLFCEKY